MAWARGVVRLHRDERGQSSVLVALTAVVFIALLAFLVQPAMAEPVYTGKSDDLFAPGSSTISNQAALEKISAGIKGPGRVQIEISLSLSVFAEKGSPVPKLAEERCQVLAEHFRQRVAGASITTYPQSIPMPVSPEMLAQKGVDSRHLGVDKLAIEVSAAAAQGKESVTGAAPIDDGRGMEPWRQALRERYQTIVAEHKECKSPGPEQECAHPNRPKGQYGYEPDLKGYIFCKCELTYGDLGGISRDLAEYDLEKIRVLQHTSPKVYELAQEIEGRLHGVKLEPYNPDLIDRELRLQNLTIKHLNRSLKYLELGIHHLKQIGPKIGAGRLQSIVGGFANGATQDRIYAIHYSTVHRRAAMDHVRALHNFVRSNLGLGAVADNGAFPVCFATTAMFVQGLGGPMKPELTPEEEQAFHDEQESGLQNIIVPALKEFGERELPLE